MDNNNNNETKAKAKSTKKVVKNNNVNLLMSTREEELTDIKSLFTSDLGKLVLNRLIEDNLYSMYPLVSKEQIFINLGKQHIIQQFIAISRMTRRQIIDEVKKQKERGLI